MVIKPIQLVPGIQSAEIPGTKIDKNQPRQTPNLKAPAGKWAFEGGQIIMNGRNVSQTINDPSLSPGLLLQIAKDLDVFRNQYLQKNANKKKTKTGEAKTDEVDPTGELGQLSALTDAIIAQIMRKLKRKYDETADGLSFHLDEEGQLNLNGINVGAFIEMARKYSNEKATLFLQGLKNRLSVILSNKGANANYDKIRETTLALFKEIDLEISKRNRS